MNNASLCQIGLIALITLREKRTAAFSLPKIIYDLYFPGHYMRRIKSIAVAIHCTSGPYTSLSATFTLMQHKYRVRAIASSGADYNPSSGNEANFTPTVFRSLQLP